MRRLNANHAIGQDALLTLNTNVICIRDDTNEEMTKGGAAVSWNALTPPHAHTTML
jgi:hypothetical protein